MLIDGGVAVNLMSYFVFKKLRREDDELMNTNLTCTGVEGGGNPMEARGIILMELTIGSKLLATAFFIIEVKVTIVLFLAVIGFTPIIASPLLCINS
jgi:hypothetical protein